jgi:hypothetical protein
MADLQDATIDKIVREVGREPASKEGLAKQREAIAERDRRNNIMPDDGLKEALGL